MSHTYAIAAAYTTCATGNVTFPEGKTWADVDDHYVKWDTLHVRFKGETDWEEYPLDSDESDGTDWKRPHSYTVLETDEYGYPDYDAPSLADVD